MVMGDGAIRKALAFCDIVIDPFEDRQLGPNSYDVRLGEWYYRPLDSASINAPFVDFTSKTDVELYWQGPFKASIAIEIKPHETILCHTIERIGGLHGCTSELRARSSVGRSCLAICKCAGMGDVGYVSRWTMEITNFASVIIPLYVGMRVGQIVFHKVEGAKSRYSGSYGQGDWTPQDMLPKLTRD